MGYIYAIRGWLELSWPDAEVEGVDETPEQHAQKVEHVRAALTTTLSPDELRGTTAPASERYKAGWAFPQDSLEGTEYICFGADVEEPPVVLEQIRAVLKLDPFADGYFSVEGEDGGQFRQWLIKSGKVYTRRQLFPDFEAGDLPTGYTLLT